MELLGDVFVEIIVTGFCFDCFGERLFIFILSRNFAPDQRKLDCKMAYRKKCILHLSLFKPILEYSLCVLLIQYPLTGSDITKKYILYQKMFCYHKVKYK